jgi:hypothetical protein
MRLFLFRSSVAVTAISLALSSLFAAPGSRVKEMGQLTVSFTLQATIMAPAGASGDAAIEVEKSKFKDDAAASLTLHANGLASGAYSVDAILKDATTVHIGDFSVNTTASGSTGPIDMPIPAAIDSLDIFSLSISDGTANTLLEGDASVSVDNWKYIANVRVTGPIALTASPNAGSKGKPVHGHAVSQSFTNNDMEHHRHFLWVAFGAPGDAELTINVDGVAVGTVMSTKQGKVMFKDLPATVLLPAIQRIEIADAAGAVVMQALF